MMKPLGEIVQSSKAKYNCTLFVDESHLRKSGCGSAGCKDGAGGAREALGPAPEGGPARRDCACETPCLPLLAVVAMVCRFSVREVAQMSRFPYFLVNSAKH